MFGDPSDNADSPVSGDASQASISKVSVAALFAGDVDDKPPDIRPHLCDLRTGWWILLDSGATASVFPRV